MGIAGLQVPQQRQEPGVEESFWSKRFSRIWPLIWPAGVTLPAQIAALWLYARAQHFHRITDFIFIGRPFSTPLGLATLAMPSDGYDGQFYYYIARLPFHAPPGSFDGTAERYSRILYPALVRLVSLGHASVIPWAMLGINLAAITGTVALLSWLLRERGLPAWLALVGGFYCGFALGTLRDLADPLLGFWLMLALVWMQRRQWLLVAGSLALGLLTRETALTFVVCFAVPLLLERAPRRLKIAAEGLRPSRAEMKHSRIAALLERRWLLLGGYFLITFGPYLAWQVVLHQWLGVWGLHDTLFNSSNNLTRIPFIGLKAAPDLHTLIQFILFACVPAVAGVIGGLLTLWECPIRDAPRLAAALGALAYGAAFMLQPGAHWLDIWAPMRLAIPLAVLFPLLLPQSQRWWRPAWLALLALMIFSFTLALAPT
ncbi:MAG TPA: hypothetical protein VFU32_09345 [Ktedonobacterales bacterium]|nr:hypothetical protein [Ktedonobacterales bacterium]